MIAIKSKQPAGLPPVPLATPQHIQVFRQAILRWYKKHGRDLPWRHTRDPYRILVSEIMLHQTQVDRVIPKYREFLSAYPTFEALAKAPLEEVQQLWRPLGYNFRPGRLHKIAQHIVINLNGQLPDTLKELITLPGIGRYTAGAILSFAFHKDAPILDTNAQRVLKRFFAIPGDPFRVPTKHQLWNLAQEVIPSGKGYIFNQGLLDFGALQCPARAPHCPTCLLLQSCPYYKTQSKIT
ncbi:MAG: A/G-specific adenine glycosylase [Promethearchaeota archaeon]